MACIAEADDAAHRAEADGAGCEVSAGRRRREAQMDVGVYERAGGEAALEIGEGGEHGKREHRPCETQVEGVVIVGFDAQGGDVERRPALD